MTIVADLRHVTKDYRLGVERSNWRALIPGPRGEIRDGEIISALSDLTLQIRAGESVGIVGANGAGKSTILKILAGVVEPTSGTVEIAGRVAPIIELGVGFNPELNGSENVRFGGALLGRTSAEIEERYDSIVEFAELDDFMETPLKRYSTGMKARLGFALVTAFDADLILLDEVLSVGDWRYQRRSLARVRELHERGAAIVAVSHSNWMISQLCEKLVLVDHGHVVMMGDPITVINRYTGEEVIDAGEPITDDRPVAAMIADPPEDSKVTITDLEVLPQDLLPGDPVEFRATLTVEEPVDAILVMSIYSFGRAAFADPEEGPSEILLQPGTWTVSGRIQHFPVAPGQFHLRLAVIPDLESADYDQEYLQSLAKCTVPFSVKGEMTTRPGLKFGTSWATEPAEQTVEHADAAPEAGS